MDKVAKKVVHDYKVASGLYQNGGEVETRSHQNPTPS